MILEIDQRTALEDARASADELEHRIRILEYEMKKNG